ncbi:hypothetical protein DINM_004687 [Dirofilaria immitis]|nr:hypothetical protein [Dirofilaria immitis]
MVISAQVLSVNIGGSSNNSNSGNSSCKGTKFGVSDKNSSPKTAKITTVDECPHYYQSQQHSKWLLNCCTSNLPTAAQKLTVLIDSIGGCIPDPITKSATNISIVTTATDSKNTTTTTITTVSAITVPESTTEQDMSRESRHVHVIGLPDSLSDERVSSFFPRKQFF